MNLYDSAGYLILGSRFRRLSEAFLSAVNKVYQQQGIPFEATWFPVFYLLAQLTEISIKDLSEQADITHPAASQLITQLKGKGLIATATSKNDGRMQLVRLTPKGKELLKKIEPIWNAIRLTLEKEIENLPESQALLTMLGTIEPLLKPDLLAKKIEQQINQI
jgi:DNA-binding MarR family transcriptional regulator